MTTPIDIPAGIKGLTWLKKAAAYIFKIGKRIATLEERVTALEEALKTVPPKACPFCGERAMRLKEQSPLLGNQGKQWTDDTWTCQKCGKDYYDRQPFKKT